MSDSAKALLHYKFNSESGCADDNDQERCVYCARLWADYIISGDAYIEEPF